MLKRWRRITWNGLVMFAWAINALVSKIDLILVKGMKKGKLKPKITLVEVIKMSIFI